MTNDMRLRTSAATLLLNLREGFTQELADLRDILQHWIGGKGKRLSGQRLQEVFSGLGWLLPRTLALWTVLLLNWALFFLVVVFWVGHRLGGSGYLLMIGTGATLLNPLRLFLRYSLGERGAPRASSSPAFHARP